MNQDERLGEVVATYRKHFGETAEVILDAGTRDGHDARYLQQNLNAQTVIAIDANPIAVSNTRSNYPDFLLIETALADYEGVAEFDQIISEREDFAGSSSLSRYGDFPGTTRNTIKVNVTTMANVLDVYMPDVSSLDVVKVDLEGYTFEFLQGLGRYLDIAKVLHLETEAFHRHEGHKTNKDVMAFMAASGFELVSKSYEWGPTIEDQLYINTSLARR